MNQEKIPTEKISGKPKEVIERAAMVDGTYRGPINGQIAEYLDYCRRVRNEGDCGIRTRASAIRQLLYVTDCSDLRALTNKDINDLIRSGLERGLLPQTINNQVAKIRSLVHWHQGMGLETKVKFSLVKKLPEFPTKRVFYTRKQIKRALKYAKQPIDWLLIEIAFETGLRLSELQGLRLNNFSGRKIRIVGKGKKVREVWITRKTRGRLDKYIRDMDITDYLWVYDEHGVPYCPARIAIRMGRVFKKAGFDDFHPHSLRHSFCTDMEARGATIRERQKMLGHASCATTEVYSHALDNRVGELFDRYRRHPRLFARRIG